MSIRTKLKYSNWNVEYPVETIPDMGKIYIYGKGLSGTAFLAWLSKCRTDVEVLGFIDTTDSGSYLGYRLYSIDEFNQLNQYDTYDEIYILSSSHQIIQNILDSKGIIKYRVITSPSYLAANILMDPNIQLLKFEQINPHPRVKQKGLHLFFGENLGKFVGNNKYFYLYLRKQLPDKVYWVAENQEVITLLQEHGLPVIDAKSDDYINYLNKASYFYFDKMTWPKAYPWLRYFNAKKIHTSHGVGLKYTELMQIPKDFILKLNKKEENWLFNNVLSNDLLLSTSVFYAENVSVMGYGTPMSQVSLVGYPKNDVIYKKIEGEDLYSDNLVRTTLHKRKADGYKIICYTPTCRHMDIYHQDKFSLEMKQVSDFCKKNKLIFVIKGHGITSTTMTINAKYDHILIYDNEKDIYPVFRDIDLLITDYSSIFMDFLHARKPIIFYPYDYKEFTALQNPLQFDYDKMTPGPKAYNWQELEQWLLYFLVEKKDKFKKEREKIFSLAYSVQTQGASERLFTEMKQRGLYSTEKNT